MNGKEIIWKYWKKIFTPKGSKRRQTHVEYFYLAVFVILVIGDVIIGSYIIYNVGQYEFISNPPHGYVIGFPIDFDFQNASSSNVLNPLVVVDVRLNATSVLGQGYVFVAELPINMSANAVIYNEAINFDNSTKLMFGFEDQQNYIGNGKFETTVEYGTPMTFNRSNFFTNFWIQSTKNFVVVFPLGGNYIPYLILQYKGENYFLKQTFSNISLPVEPAGTLGSVASNNVNIIVGLAIYFFALIETFVLLHEIYPKAFPKVFGKKDYKTDGYEY